MDTAMLADQQNACVHQQVMGLLSSEIVTVSRVQILDVAVCLLQSTSPLGKGMKPTILSSAMGK